MKHTTEDVALRLLSSMVAGNSPAAVTVKNDRLIARAFRMAEEFIAERDKRRAEVEQIAEELTAQGVRC